MKSYIAIFLLPVFLQELKAASDTASSNGNRRYKNLVYTNMLNLALRRVDIAYERFIAENKSVSLNYFKGKTYVLNSSYDQWAVIGRFRIYSKKSGWYLNLNCSYSELLFTDHISEGRAAEVYHDELLGLGSGFGYLFRPFDSDRRFIIHLFSDAGANFILKEKLLYDKYPEKQSMDYDGKLAFMLRFGFALGYSF